MISASLRDLLVLMCRVRRFFVLACFAGCTFSVPPHAASFTDKQEDHGVYYRLKVGLSHDGERIDFDIVVGCSVRVTNYKDGDRSFDALSYPVTYMTRITGGHGVLVRPMRFCEGATTDNGKVPKDFLPPVIWYEDADDWLLGIGYFSMDAYENPRAKLAFHGASVHSATHTDFQAFLTRAAEENLVPQEGYFRKISHPNNNEIAAHSWDKQWLSRQYPFIPRCHGVRRFVLTGESAKAILQKDWPASRPRYWTLPIDMENRSDQAVFKELRLLNGKKGPRIGALHLRDYYRWGNPALRGLPGPSGEVLYLANPPHYSPPYYPLRKDFALPWINPERIEERDFALRFELDGGGNKGFLYCYQGLGLSNRMNNWFGGDFFPAAFGSVPCLIDGEPLHWPGQRCTRAPTFFFERDEVLFWPVEF